MAPAAWLRMATATGRQEYLDFMVRHWWQTSDYLYDPGEHLYFRDDRFFTRRERNGRKVFWSRGNGWVMAGLARVVQDLPKDNPSRPRFVRQFREMADRIVTLQQPDGFWRASLLDPASYPMRETSGTGFYVYALGWGVNEGLLERSRFEPAVIKGWNALLGSVHDDGKLVHVQPIGETPVHFDEESTDVYGVGAFLLAGSEVYRLVGGSRQAAISDRDGTPAFRVLAFFTAKEDQAHISFVHEAVRWFPQTAAEYNFRFDTTSDWRRLNQSVLSNYEVVVFLDTRPEDPAQRAAFQAYMEHGGAWMGFHFAGFALTPSAVPANWSWYHDTFLGAGSYVSNTWRPTSAILRVEDRTHPATQHLPETFRSSPNEWYRWERDLRRNPDIDILVSIDSTSFPLGTGPKPNEIWHGGYYPVAWTNRKYRMMYLNVGHNDIDYEHRFDATNRTLSYTLGNPVEDQLIIDGLLWLGNRANQAPRP
ncbi:MAG TPA: glycoside hydrolase family 88 protein, partial [Gemmatimonadaceae bacterium]